MSVIKKKDYVTFLSVFSAISVVILHTNGSLWIFNALVYNRNNTKRFGLNIFSIIYRLGMPLVIILIYIYYIYIKKNTGG